MAELINIEDLNHQLKLKPSFKVEVDHQKFKDQLSNINERGFTDDVRIKQMDEHIWLSFPKSKRKYYSPRLHIEIENKDKFSILHCTFGPDPGLWTMFMFVHFFLGLSFIGLLIWLYTNVKLDNSNILVYILMLVIILCWITLYVFARQNRRKAAPQSKILLNRLYSLAN